MTLLWLLLLPLITPPQPVAVVEINTYGDLPWQATQTIWRDDNGLIVDCRSHRKEHEPSDSGLSVWLEHGQMWHVKARELWRTLGRDRDQDQRLKYPRYERPGLWK